MMRRVSMLLTIIFLQAFFSQSAVAEANPKDGKVWYFVTLPAYYFFVEIPIHEGSHALAAGLNPNFEVSKFQPWPHYTEHGSLVLGSVMVTCASREACDDKIGLGVIFLAPYVTATTIFTASDLLLFTKVVEPASITGRVLYFAGMIVPWWDFSYNAIWATNISDAAQIAKNFQISRWSVMAVGTGVSVVGVWRLWAGYKRAFSGQTHGNVKESNLVIVPMGDSGTIGASAIMRF